MSADLTALLLDAAIPDNDESDDEHEARPSDQIFHMSHNALFDWLMTRQLQDLIALLKKERLRVSASLDSKFATRLTEFQILPSLPSSRSHDKSLLNPVLRSIDISATPEVSYLTTEHSFRSFFA
jgi:hypothetical protein